MSKFHEVEFKYDASNIDMGQFRDAVYLWFDVKREVTISGYDDYYTSGTQYLRHRYNADKAELTVKRRHTAASTAVRDEVDVKIGEGQAREVGELAKLLGYQHDFTIYKTCQIYFLADVNIVYYIVYTASMQERGRIVEIEANKDYTGDSLEAIVKAERLLGVNFLDYISESNRLNKTMHELYTEVNNAST